MLDFFHPKAKAKARAKGKAKAKAGTLAKTVKQRITSHQCLRVLDNALKVGRGVGLSAFKPDARGSGDALHRRPLLVWHFDQASTNMSVAQFLSYCLKLRVLPIFDIIHREWNDVSLAVQRTGLWSGVLFFFRGCHLGPAISPQPLRLPDGASVWSRSQGLKHSTWQLLIDPAFWSVGSGPLGTSPFRAGPPTLL